MTVKARELMRLAGSLIMPLLDAVTVLVLKVRYGPIDLSMALQSAYVWQAVCGNILWRLPILEILTSVLGN